MLKLVGQVNLERDVQNHILDVYTSILNHDRHVKGQPRSTVYRFANTLVMGYTQRLAIRAQIRPLANHS